MTTEMPAHWRASCCAFQKKAPVCPRTFAETDDCVKRPEMAAPTRPDTPCVMKQSKPATFTLTVA
jgi:hypothetical protein